MSILTETEPPIDFDRNGFARRGSIFEFPVRRLLLDLSYLQGSNGAFSSTEIDLKNGTTVCCSDVFATALITWLLSELPAIHFGNTRVLLRKASRWLKTQRSSSGLWGFRGKYGEFPADIDDTSVALMALFNCGEIHRSEFRLIPENFYQNESGYFGTWTKAAIPSAQTYDVTANGHTFLALGKGQISNPLLNAQLLEQLGKSPVLSQAPYYCTGLPFLVVSIVNQLGRRSVSLESLNRAKQAIREVSKEKKLINKLGKLVRSERWPREARPLYRRRRFPVFFTSDAVILAYKIFLIENTIRQGLS